MNLKPRLSSGGKVEPSEGGWRLWIPAGAANRYRLSQVDDHQGIARSRYPYRAPVHMELEARVSSASLPGTWGFGLWNDPYGLSFIPGGGLVRLPALPNAVWFFGSSPVSFLSFRDDKPGNGFLAQVFSSPKFDALLARAVVTFPFSRRATRRLLARLIDEDAAAITHDVTAWHKYTLDWTEHGTRFMVDGATLLDTPTSPRGPMGIVIWIDNQFAGYRPDGKVTFGLERNLEPAWMDIRDLQVS